MGTWNNTPVALKVLTNEGGIIPSPMVRHSLHLGDELLMSSLQAIRHEIEVIIRKLGSEFRHHINSDFADMVNVETYSHPT